MGHEIFTLLCFLTLPLGLALLLRVFFRRLRLGQRAGTGAGRAARLLMGNLLVLAFLLSIAALLGEVYYRFFYDSTDGFGLTRTTMRWFRRHYQMNNAGVRDNLDYEVLLRPGRRRLTFLGDSFTAGHGIADVDQRFANLVRRMRPAWDVHVLAQNGWDTGHQLDLLGPVLDRATQGSYRLDQVILVYCLNDISDIIPEWAQVAKRIFDRPAPPYLVRHSYLLNTYYYRLLARSDGDISSYYQFTLRGYEGPIWAEQQRRLQLMNQLVRRRGGRLSIVIFPFLHALGSGYAYRGVHERLGAFLRAQGIPSLDLLPTFAGLSAREATLNPYDPHPSERAHRMAAEAIAPFADQLMSSPAAGASGAPAP
jgi:lysophospholipase L1-like esterase